MVRPQSKARAVQNDRAPDGRLGCLKFPDDLLEADTGVLFIQYIGKIDLSALEKVDQCPGGTSALIKDIVYFQPWGLYF